MIQNDRELSVTQERVAEFQRIVSQLRTKARPEEFAMVASSYLSEIETMQKDILAYLSRHPSQIPASVVSVR